MGKTITPRIRCPCCGRLAWYSMYKRDYNLEIIANIYHGGRANKHWYTMQPYTDSQMLKEARDFMAKRCFLISQQLGYAVVQPTNIAYPIMNMETNSDPETITAHEYPGEVDYVR